MKTIIFDLPSDMQTLKIIPFADWHKDDPRCDENFIKSQVKAILEDDSAYGIANGDLLNFALTNSKSDSYSSKINPTEQVDWLCETLYPIRHKLLAFGDGNHEGRAYKESGLKVGRFVTAQLGIPQIYHDTGALVFVSFGGCLRRKSEARKSTYSIYVKHGCGGGKKEGGKINALVDFANTVDADCYIGSHTHLPLAFPTGYFRVNRNNRSVQLVNKLFVNTGAALDFGGYAESGGYKPAAKAHIEILFDGAKRGMEARLRV